MKTYYTYLHCKPDGIPFYVGKGTATRSHCLKRRNRHYASVIDKYGERAILVFVFECDSEEQAFADEIQQIAQLRADGYRLTNKTEGGDGIRNPSPELRAKISATLTGRKGRPCSDETKALLSAIHKGKIPSEQCREAAKLAITGSKRPPFSVEWRRRMSEVKKNPSPETRAKRSAANIGKIMSAESRAKMSAAKKGKPWSAARRAAWGRGVDCEGRL